MDAKSPVSSEQNVENQLDISELVVGLFAISGTAVLAGAVAISLAGLVQWLLSWFVPWGVPLKVAVIFPILATFALLKLWEASDFQAIMVTLCLAASVYFLLWAFPWCKSFIAAQISALSQQSIRRFGIWVAIGISLALFWLRLKARLAYGVIEVLFACYVTWVKLPDIDVLTIWHYPTRIGDSQWAIGLVSGSIFLTVRGMDNIHEAWNTRDQYLKHFKRFFQILGGVAPRSKAPESGNPTLRPGAAKLQS